MMPLVSGFQAELEKLAFGPHVNLRAMQLALAAKILGVDPTMPVPYKGSVLEDEISRLRMEEELRGTPKLGAEKSAALWVTPRSVRRIVDMAGVDEDSPRFKQIAYNLTGQTSIAHMNQRQLRILGSILAGRVL